MKGRINYDQVNSSIDEIHKVVSAKYKILGLPRSAMGEPVMKKYKVGYKNYTSETFGLLKGSQPLSVRGHKPKWRKFLEFQSIIEKRRVDQEQKRFCRSA